MVTSRKLLRSSCFFACAAVRVFPPLPYCSDALKQPAVADRAAHVGTRQLHNGGSKSLRRAHEACVGRARRGGHGRVGHVGQQRGSAGRLNPAAQYRVRRGLIHLGDFVRVDAGPWSGVRGDGSTTSCRAREREQCEYADAHGTSRNAPGENPSETTRM